MTEPREQETDPRPADEVAEEEAATETAKEAEVDEEPAEPTEEPSLEETLRAERDAFEEKWLRVVAELDNVRKRSRREVVETRRFAQADVLRSLLEFQDHFERALQTSEENQDTGESNSFRDGVELIFQELRRVLKDKGVEPMEAMGAEFDPNFHEAVGQLAREGTEPGRVIEVVQQGFHFGDLVLRPARVIISS